MKLGFISDTHDNKEVIINAFKFFEENGIRNVFHLGDLISPFNLRFIREVYTGSLYLVLGNNDGEEVFISQLAKEFNVNLFRTPQVLDVSGIRIALMHEPFAINELAESQKFDVVAYGHTHKIHLEFIGKTFVVNPGEACGYLTGKRSFVVYDTSSKTYKLEEI